MRGYIEIISFETPFAILRCPYILAFTKCPGGVLLTYRSPTSSKSQLMRGNSSPPIILNWKLYIKT